MMEGWEEMQYCEGRRAHNSYLHNSCDIKLLGAISTALYFQSLESLRESSIWSHARERGEGKEKEEIVERRKRKEDQAKGGRKNQNRAYK